MIMAIRNQLIILFLLISIVTNSQSIRLTIQTNTPSTIVLYSNTDSLIKLTQTQVDFQIIKGIYRFKGTSAGYENYFSKKMEVSNDTTIIIFLIPKKQNLENVVVISKKL